MGKWVFLCIPIVCLLILFLLESCMASVQNKGNLKPGFQGSQMFWIDNDGLFLVSNNSNFAFGFTTTQDVTLFLLLVIHKDSSTTVWSANRGSPVRNSDSFVFDDNGNAYLQRGGSTIWSTGTSKKGVSAMELLDSGNLVLRGNDGSVVWQSFSHPTDTLLPNQEFSEGMKLVSDPGSNNLSYSLEIKSGDMILSADFQPPQPYWAMGSDTLRTINKDGNNTIIMQMQLGLLFWEMMVLLLSSCFKEALQIPPQQEYQRISAADLQLVIPIMFVILATSASVHQHFPRANFGARPSCNNSRDSVELVSPGDGLSYFALGFVQPFSKTDLNGCKDSCLRNCSCGAMFFDSDSGNCFLFDQIGSMQGSLNRVGYASYVKISSNGRYWEKQWRKLTRSAFLLS
ncbi:G-type lectin S-receptor-like serine/threonine-protein kinase SD2-5 [Abeliophyllum distichum]|uniref:G-type lectin S-receptor-like serine/threonine-protein kinase SD2-5 n=1 Tax=Abeliophyllum distichum TaxID=126358 RepID=A0ABD1TZ70_9LAMI